MLDPRIYRAGFLAVALAAIVFAFSLRDQPAALQTNLAPQAFNGAAAYNSMSRLAGAYPHRGPGSPGDRGLADYVRTSLSGLRRTFTVSTDRFSAATAGGTRELENVMALNPGLAGGTIVVVSSRDAAGSPATASLSGTAVMLQLAQVLVAQSLNHSVMLVSTTGSVGAAGATRLAQRLAGGALDAVIVLGDLASARASEPVVIPWSNGSTLAPPALRNTVAATLASQANLAAGSPGLPAQLARLAFPLTISPQGPFAARGEPAVLLSVSGERGPAPGAGVGSQSRISSLGQAVLQTIDALDANPSLPAPSTYLTINAKLIPFWSIRLLVLALLLPVIAVTVDGLARARRRGHSPARWAGWALAGAVPFLLAGLLVRAAALVSLLPATPPGPVGAGGVRLSGAGIALLVLVGLVLVAAFVWLRPLCIHAAARLARERPLRRSPEGGSHAGAGPALLAVACLAALALWAANPFAAALLVPALHLWIWVADAELPLRRPLALLLVAIGLIAPGLVLAYYVHAFALSPSDVLWNGALLIAGGQLGLIAVLEWSVVLGCLAGAVALAGRSRGARDGPLEPVTVRGPITYAGPGSLGGTESALRR